ncbi:hypothetical protein GGF37_000816 [Kickxella alabastrina]|nr:hypothetical protein GGF37_000816 [Kickxella alabastrina]
MDRKKYIGVIAAQSLTEPLTQASLSSFHFLGKSTTSKDAIAEFGKIITGNFDEIIVTVDCNVFDPFETFDVNFLEFSKLERCRVGTQEIDRGKELLRCGAIDKNYYVGQKSVVSIVISPDKFPVTYLCFLLSERDAKHRYIPFNEKRIDVIGGTESQISQIVFSDNRKRNIVPYSFDIDKYVNDSQMTFTIHDCDLDMLGRVNGLLSYELQKYSKVVKYYGIEYLRDMIKDRLRPIVGDDQNSDLLADHLCSKGKFLTQASNIPGIISSIGSLQINSPDESDEEDEWHMPGSPTI